MADLGSNIGPSSTRRRVATLIAVIGMVFVGGLLARVWPRDVEIAYSPGPNVTNLDVDYLHEGEAVASVRFTRSEGKPDTFRHTVRLQPGEYEVRITVSGPENRGVDHLRSLVVPSEGLIRFNLRESTVGPE